MTYVSSSIYDKYECSIFDSWQAYDYRYANKTAVACLNDLFVRISGDFFVIVYFRHETII